MSKPGFIAIALALGLALSVGVMAQGMTKEDDKGGSSTEAKSAKAHLDILILLHRLTSLPEPCLKQVKVPRTSRKSHSDE